MQISLYLAPLNLEAGCGEEFVEVEPEFFEERLFGLKSHMGLGFRGLNSL